MNTEEYRYKRSELDQHFTPDFIKLCYSSPLAHAVYTTLVMGSSPHQMIEELVVRLNEVQEDYQNLILKSMESKIM